MKLNQNWLSQFRQLEKNFRKIQSKQPSKSEEKKFSKQVTTMKPQTFFDKIWNSHVVKKLKTANVLYILIDI